MAVWDYETAVSDTETTVSDAETAVSNSNTSVSESVCVLSLLVNGALSSIGIINLSEVPTLGACNC